MVGSDALLVCTSTKSSQQTLSCTPASDLVSFGGARATCSQTKDRHRSCRRRGSRRTRLVHHEVEPRLDVRATEEYACMGQADAECVHAQSRVTEACVALLAFLLLFGSVILLAFARRRATAETGLARTYTFTAKEGGVCRALSEPATRRRVVNARTAGVCCSQGSGSSSCNRNAGNKPPKTLLISLEAGEGVPPLSPRGERLPRPAAAPDAHTHTLAHARETQHARTCPLQVHTQRKRDTSILRAASCPNRPASGSWFARQFGGRRGDAHATLLSSKLYTYARGPSRPRRASEQKQGE